MKNSLSKHLVSMCRNIMQGQSLYTTLYEASLSSQTCHTAFLCWTPEAQHPGPPCYNRSPLYKPISYLPKKSLVVFHRLCIVLNYNQCLIVVIKSFNMKCNIHRRWSNVASIDLWASQSFFVHKFCIPTSQTIMANDTSSGTCLC